MSGWSSSSSAVKSARLLIVGSYDLFHYGHVRAFKNAKEAVPGAVLVVGVVNDAVVLAQKGAPVMSARERAEVVAACRYVDEVIDDCPWIPDLQYLDQHRINFIVGDEDSRLLYSDLVDAGRFQLVPRTEGVSTTMILTRVIGNYSSYLKRSVRSGIDMKDYNVSLLRRARVNASMAVDQQKAKIPNWASPQYLAGYLRQVGEKVLGDWNAIGQGREQMIERLNLVPVDIEQKDTETVLREAQFLKLCQQFVPGWKSLALSDLSFSVVNGGLTNQLTKASVSNPELLKRLKGDIPRKVLIRVYGAGTESFFQRDTEHRIFSQFSEQGIGPKLYGYFDGGRIEEFLDATSLSTAEFANHLSAIGTKIAEMHRAHVDLPRRPSLFSNLYMWFDAAKNASLDKPEDKELLKKIDFAALEAEIGDLKERLGALNSPITFCHNDLICGNMMKYDDGRIMFIDYEYGSYNFRGYDFGNHFDEWTIDYTVKEYPKFKIDATKYPSDGQQRAIFTAYIRRSHELASESTTVTEDEIHSLQAEAVRFSLAAHMLWSLWAIKQASTSDIDFGYMDYAVQRISEYYKLKKQVYGENN